MNIFFRARHMAPVRADTWTKVGFALHIMMNIVNKSWKKENADHVVFCLEGSSWRKTVYAPYKKNRVAVMESRSEKQVEEDEEIFKALLDFQDFLREKTNVTVLRNEIAEADDMIANWIFNHVGDEHVILSSDSDYYQLLTDKVHMYNGVQNHMITLDGHYDDRGKTVQITVKKRDQNGKLVKDKNGDHVMEKVDKPAPHPKWELFEKCMRGDASDNIFSAYPGVRVNGSAKTVGLREAFADMDGRGFAWNNMMLQRWTDHEGKEHRVLDDYLRNMSLVDLTALPDDIQEFVTETVKQGAAPKNIPKVGRHFLQFCGKYDLKKVAEYSDQYVEWLKADYE